VSTICGASDELGLFAAKFGLPRAMEHMDFLRAGGADLISDGALGEDWPLPSDVECLWRLMTIDGIGAKTVTALLDGLKDDACRRAVEEIGRHYRIVTPDEPG
jgi:hypothetical protein